MRQIDTSVVRHLNAADGYLELGMPSHALTELEAIRDAGPLRPAVEFMTGLALKDQHRYEDAIELLHRAAMDIPVPHNKDAWRTLSECYRVIEKDELADIAEMFADDPGIPSNWDAELACLEETETSTWDESNSEPFFHLEWGSDLLDDRFPSNLNLPKK